jgi:hypothetical protein
MQTTHLLFVLKFYFTMMIVVVLIFGIVHIVVTYCVVIGLDEAT